ncbi:MAG: hypothetical protein Q8P41_25110 [Pseudomonadota bacterium]|nr:hypothetical protein [Pseudomonadota bacterium]
MISILLALLACTGAPTDTGATASECGDPDGFGTDTGDIPNVLGNWTSQFALNFYDDDCSTENLDADSESWIGSFELDGRAPDALYMSFGSSAERYWGAMDQNGGMTLAGQHVHPEGTLYAQFGGLVYRDQYQDRDVIDGSAFLGLDVDADGVIDCRAKGSWKAYKSGL